MIPDPTRAHSVGSVTITGLSQSNDQIEVTYEIARLGLGSETFDVEINVIDVNSTIGSTTTTASQSADFATHTDTVTVTPVDSSVTVQIVVDDDNDNTATDADTITLSDTSDGGGGEDGGSGSGLSLADLSISCGLSSTEIDPGQTVDVTADVSGFAPEGEVYAVPVSLQMDGSEIGTGSVSVTDSGAGSHRWTVQLDNEGTFNFEIVPSQPQQN